MHALSPHLCHARATSLQFKIAWFEKSATYNFQANELEDCCF